MKRSRSVWTGGAACARTATSTKSRRTGPPERGWLALSQTELSGVSFLTRYIGCTAAGRKCTGGPGNESDTHSRAADGHRARAGARSRANRILRAEQGPVPQLQVPGAEDHA